MPLEEHSALASWEAGKLTLWSSTQVPHYLHRTLAKVLELPASRIRVIAAPRRRRLRRQERPLLARDRRGQAGHRHRPPGEDHAHARGGVLRAPRPPPGADGGQVRLHGGRPDHRALLPQHPRRRRLRELRRGDHLLHGRAPDDDLPRFRPTASRPCACTRTSRRAGPSAATARPQPRFALECHLDKVAEELGLDPVELRLRNAIEPFSQTVNHLRITSCGLRRVHREGRRGLGLPRQARQAAIRPRRRLRRERLPLRRRAAHLLQRHAPVGGADQGRPGRRRDRLLDGRRHRPGLELGARLHRRRGARASSRRTSPSSRRTPT